MAENELNDAAIDWSLTTWKGAQVDVVVAREDRRDARRGGRGLRVNPGLRRGAHSALIPAARITFPQRSISSGRNLARYSGPRRSGGTISSPRASSRARSAGLSSMSFITLLIFRTIASGVPFGKKKAFHTLASTP